MADIATELGMSRANIYRFFPSKDAISESVCGRILSRASDVAVAIASRNVPALEKLEQILSAVHHHNKMQLTGEKRMHALVATAAREDWPVIKAHEERMMTILEAIVREGKEADEFEVEDPAETACAVNTAFTPFFHPILIEHSVRRGEDTEAALREQFRFIQKALGQRLKGSGLFEECTNLSVYVARGEAWPAYKRAFDAQLAVFTAASSG
ncbi:TetR family transcriptional regulator [Sinorhizobium sp. CCBAU 05631]